MARTVIAVFESVYAAKKAVWELTYLGYPRERIDLFADRTAEDASALAKPETIRAESVTDELRTGANIGFGIGGSLGIVGGLLVSLGTLHIPFFTANLGEPLTLGGVFLATIVTGILAGGLLGSLMGGLLGLGIPEEEIEQYAKHVRKENITVMVVADWDAVDGTIEILGRHNPLEIKQKAIEWQKVSSREKKLAERALHVKATEEHRPH